MLDLPNSSSIEGNAIRWGKLGNGPPLVAIHGTPFSSQVWRRIVPHLAAHRTVYFYDLAGYGQSEMREGQDVSLAVQNKVLAALFKEWGLERPDVLAHDFGGATALRAYYIDGLRYASLTIFDAVALAPWGSPFVQHVRQHEAAFSGMPDYMHRALLVAYLQTATHNPLSDEAIELYSAPWLGPIGQPAFYRQIAQMDQRFTDELQDLYAKMDCQVRVLWGKEDGWIPCDKGEELAALISSHPCTLIEGAGHLVQEDRPEAIVAAVLAQIASSEPTVPISKRTALPTAEEGGENAGDWPLARRTDNQNPCFDRRHRTSFCLLPDCGQCGRQHGSTGFVDAVEGRTIPAGRQRL